MKKYLYIYLGYEVVATVINYATKSTKMPSLLSRVVFPAAYDEL